MREYIYLLNDIINTNSEKEDRTGVGNISIVGAQMRTDLREGFPALLTRRVAPRIAFEELMFMLNGKTQTKELEEKKINIWKGNTNKEFQESVGLGHLEEGDFGRMYGAQLRNFHGIIDDKCPVAIDQLYYMLDTLAKDRYSRRIISTHYNPAEAKEGVLFPCHIMTQFIVTEENKLNCVYWMRSSDTIYGLPYNHMYYAFLTHMIAEFLGFQVGDLVYQAGDAHIYNNQIPMAKQIIYSRSVDTIGIPRPTLKLKKPIKKVFDLLNYKWEDVIIEDYNPLPDFKNKPPMAQ